MNDSLAWFAIMVLIAVTSLIFSAARKALSGQGNSAPGSRGPRGAGGAAGGPSSRSAGSTMKESLRRKYLDLIQGPIGLGGITGAGPGSPPARPPSQPSGQARTPPPPPAQPRPAWPESSPTETSEPLVVFKSFALSPDKNRAYRIRREEVAIPKMDKADVRRTVVLGELLGPPVAMRRNYRLF